MVGIKTITYLNILLRRNIAPPPFKNLVLAESFLIKEKRSTLTTQKKSIPLKLFN